MQLKYFNKSACYTKTNNIFCSPIFLSCSSEVVTFCCGIHDMNSTQQSERMRCCSLIFFCITNIIWIYILALFNCSCNKKWHGKRPYSILFLKLWIFCSMQYSKSHYLPIIWSSQIHNSYFRATELLFSLAWGTKQRSSDWMLAPESGLTKLLSDSRRSLSLFQHHDAITGTAKDHVVEDYAKK